MTVHEDAGVVFGVPRWVLAVLAPVVVVLLALSVRTSVAPSSELSIETAPPDAAPAEPADTQPADVTFCPTGKPVTVVSGLAYPPGHPAAPALPPDACFASIRAATRSGHEVAPAPSYVEVLHGMYLLPISNVAFDQCLAMAGDAGFEIPCVGRRPSGGVLSICAGSCVTGGGFIWAMRSIPAPADWCRRCLPDVVVAAAPVDAPAVVQALARCGPGNGGHPPWKTFFCDQQPGPANTQVHAGNTMRRGRHDDIVFAVSVGGRGPAQRQLLDRIFDSLLFVGR